MVLSLSLILLDWNPAFFEKSLYGKCKLYNFNVSFFLEILLDRFYHVIYIVSLEHVDLL